MKKFLLAVVVFCLSVPSFAQKIKFTNSTNVWSMLDSTTGCCIPIANAYVRWMYDSASAVSYNGQHYQYYASDVASFLVREDSARVYVIGTDDSVERVLYDYTLGVNDTLKNIYTADTLVAWVTQLDSTMVGGLWYKVWHFEGLDYCPFKHTLPLAFRYNVIEGIGCTNGPYYPASPYNLDLFSEQLLCFSNSVISGATLSSPVTAYGDIYTTSFDNNNSCNKFLTDTGSHGEALGVAQSQHSTLAQVVPNPVSGDSRIVLPYTMGLGTLVIINAAGQTTATIQIERQRELQIGNKITVPGNYYYRVIDSRSGKTFSGKFTYQ